MTATCHTNELVPRNARHNIWSQRPYYRKYCEDVFPPPSNTREFSSSSLPGQPILLYKRQWNPRWAFARKLDIFRCENNMLSSHVKISLLLWLHNKPHLSDLKMLWYFIGVYIINRTLHGHLEIPNFSSFVKEKYFARLLRSLVKYFSTLEEKFRISAWPCNIFYIYVVAQLYL